MGIIKSEQVGNIKDENGDITISVNRVNKWNFIKITQPGFSTYEMDEIDINKGSIKKLITILKKIK